VEGKVWVDNVQLERGHAAHEFSDDSFVSGKIGDGLGFDGVDDYVNLGNVLNMPNQRITTSFWVYLTGNPGTSQYIIDKGLSGTNGWGIRLNNRDVEFGFHGGCTANSNTDIIDRDKWIHVAIVGGDGTETKFYVDGVQQAAINNGCWPYIVSSQGDTIIGKRIDTNQYHMNGLLDELKIYNRELNATEIIALAG
jgi:hypothetical protein